MATLLISTAKSIGIKVASSAGVREPYLASLFLVETSAMLVDIFSNIIIMLQLRQHFKKGKFLPDIDFFKVSILAIEPLENQYQSS